MKTLKVDEKWSIEYDESANDKPVSWLRHGDNHSPFSGNNAVFAMFYSLLKRTEVLTRISNGDNGRGPNYIICHNCAGNHDMATEAIKT